MAPCLASPGTCCLSRALVLTNMPQLICTTTQHACKAGLDLTRTHLANSPQKGKANAYVMNSETALLSMKLKGKGKTDAWELPGRCRAVDILLRAGREHLLYGIGSLTKEKSMKAWNGSVVK